MDFETYKDLLEKQKNAMTPECKEAIIEQIRLHEIVVEKQRIKDELYEKWYRLFVSGCGKLLEQFPEISNKLTDSEIKAEALKEIIFHAQNKTAEYLDVINKMKSIPELNESASLNEPLGKAYYDFFSSLANLNNRINIDREKLFTNEYRVKMQKLANDGVFLFFLDTPDFPLLDEKCDANYVLESISFDGYTGARALLDSFRQVDSPGEPLLRKIKDAHDALEMMYNGCFRGAARNWFALIEHEHKRCADILEGFWEKKKNFKNGMQRSEKIQRLIEALDDPWLSEAWESIDAYYKKIQARTSEKSDIINRNAIIHGDYDNDALDISENDTIKLFLMWINLRLIADSFAYDEELIDNMLTMLPYFCEMSLN